jgi:hypothetical protein
MIEPGECSPPFGCTVPELVEGQGQLRALTIDVRSILLLIAIMMLRSVWSLLCHQPVIVVGADGELIAERGTNVDLLCGAEVGNIFDIEVGKFRQLAVRFFGPDPVARWGCLSV